ncbi:hypothetical protein WN51_09356 [Melipona quadrifasciata]|uniref:Uncharacterized protein n=1 Tax=Melipona quadrifasciata TaxID=166423 RepID=A0A0N0BIM9_9HYME|nr:hypothetical protein WN51_09356 [Melipona quadrifasciata]
MALVTPFRVKRLQIADAFEGKLSVARVRLRATLTNDVFTACPPFVERFRVQPERIAESSPVFLEPFPRTRPIPSCPIPAISKLVRFPESFGSPAAAGEIRFDGDKSVTVARDWNGERRGAASREMDDAEAAKSEAETEREECEDVSA